MRSTQFDANVLKKLILKEKIVTMEQMKEALGTQADTTIFRKLRELSYLCSYSHGGKYYTLAQVPRFDELGLWIYDEVRFSRQGPLVNTIAHLVEQSDRGYFENDLSNLLGVCVRVPALKLSKEGRLSRQKVAGRYLYCSADTKARERQVAAAKREHAIGLFALEPMPSWLQLDEAEKLLQLFLGFLDQRQRSLFAGLESLKLGPGGDTTIAQLFGLHRQTVAKGRNELRRGITEMNQLLRSDRNRRSQKDDS